MSAILRDGSYVYMTQVKATHTHIYNIDKVQRFMTIYAIYILINTAFDLYFIV